jgi:hypothetical protein
VPEDERQRRRLGDATRDRIADLADGWNVPSQPPDPKGTPAPRPPTDSEGIPTAPYEKADEPPDSFDQKPTTVAAPPPEALEVLRGHAEQPPAPDSGVQRRSMTAMRAEPGRTKPPPPPPGSKRPTSPPPIPARPVIEATTSRDDDATTVDPGAMDALAPTLSAQAHVVAGLRDAPTLRRRPGALGHLTYVFTVWAGVRRARRELATVEAELAQQKAARADRLAELGRAAVSDERFDQTAVRSSRDELADIEERRSRHAGAAAASDAELEAIERDRDREHRRHEADIEAAQAEIAKLDGELAPLEKEATGVRKRAAEVKSQLATLDGKMAAVTASLVKVKGPAADRAGVEAELATLRADKQAVQRDEPKIAAALDNLLPRIASLKAARADADAKIAAARQGQDAARDRAVEQVAAVQARRKVEARAVAEAAGDRDRALVGLGERLYADRPKDLTRKLDAVEQRDLAIATAERRAIELRELIGSVERGALIRGILLWILILGAIGAATFLVLTRA